MFQTMGHELELVHDGVRRRFRYKDTHEFKQDVPARPCKKCGQYATTDGHDPCIKNLPGVSFACCGHGTGYGYISFDDGTVIRFRNISIRRRTRMQELTNKTPHVVGILLVCTYFIWMMVL